MWLNLQLAWRNLRKFRLFSAINLLGLSIGLAIFIFCGLLVHYETNHDHMFAKRDRIVTVGSAFAPTSGEPISQYPNVRTAYGPLLARDIPGLERVVRTRFEQRVVSAPAGSTMLGLRFVDPGFTALFDFNYLAGRVSEGDLARGIVLTASAAQQLFGRSQVVGQTLMLEHRLPLTVVAVIEDVAPDSHFNSSLMPDVELTAFTSMAVLADLAEVPLAGEWTSLNPTDLTYLLLPPGYDLAQLAREVNAVARRYAPAEEWAYIDELLVRPLRLHNTQVWDSLRFPVVESIALLGVLVMLAAVLNYVNLATVQYADRAREVGLRKIFGATPAQLTRQLLSESLLLVAIATWLALVLVELSLPLFNAWSGKHLYLQYEQLLPLLLGVALCVGVLAGAIPAWQANGYSPVRALYPARRQWGGGPRLRQSLVAVQFAIAVFILALVAVVALQNLRIEQLSNSFPRHHVWLLSQMEKLPANARQHFIRSVAALPGVHVTSLSGAVPFLRLGSSLDIYPGTVSQPAPTREPATEQSPITIIAGAIDGHFLTAYDTPLLAGRSFTPADLAPDVQPLPVIVNQSALQLLAPETELGHIFWARTGDDVNAERRQLQVVGLVPDQYFLGVHMAQRPIIFTPEAQLFNYLSLRIAPTQSAAARVAVADLWAQLFPDQPLQMRSLNFYFQRFYKIPAMIARVMGWFAWVAAAMAMVGVFGLAVFVSRRRAREMALRKVLGASARDVIQLLVWQFSKPLLAALCLALPAAWLAAQVYLRFFPEQIAAVWVPVLAAGAGAWLLAAGVLVCQAWSVARVPPAQNLVPG